MFSLLVLGILQHLRSDPPNLAVSHRRAQTRDSKNIILSEMTMSNPFYIIRRLIIEIVSRVDHVSVPFGTILYAPCEVHGSGKPVRVRIRFRYRGLTDGESEMKEFSASALSPCAQGATLLRADVRP